MTDVSKIKAIKFAEDNDLKTMVTIGENGIFAIPKDIHEKLVLIPLGYTSKDHDKIVKREEELFGGMLYHTGNLAVEHFKGNAEAVEVGFSYNAGSNTTVSGLFNREAKDHTVVAVDTRYKNADIKRILSYLGDEIGNINT